MLPLRSVLTSVTILFLFGLPCRCIAHPDSVLHKNFAQRYHYVDSLRRYIISINKNPAEAQKTLDKLIADAQKQNDEALAYQLKISNIYTNAPRNQAWLEERELEDIKQAKQKGYVLEAADGYHILSEWLWNNGNHGKGIECALLCHELSLQVPIKDFPPKVKNTFRLAIWYYLYKEYKKSIHYTLELEKTDKGSLYELNGICLNTLALDYRALGQYDSAIYYFNIIYEDKRDIKDIMDRAVAAGNIGITYGLQGNYANAITWMKRELDLSRAGNNIDNISCLNAYVGIAGIYLKIGDKKNAQLYLDSAKQIRPHIKDAYRLNNYYGAYATALKEAGDYKQALAYTDSLIAANEDIAKSTNLLKIVAAEKRIDLLKQNVTMEQLKRERQKSVWLRNYLIVIISFLSILALMLINRSRLQHKQKELELENAKTKAEARLSDYTLKLQEKNLQLVELQEELEELNNEEDIANKSALISQLQQSTILTDEQWEDFRNVFEQVHTGFIHRLKDTYPDITPAEMQYIALVKLNMTNKEIANVLGISANSVRNYKFRLRKKFNLTENDDLENIIRSV